MEQQQKMLINQQKKWGEIQKQNNQIETIDKIYKNDRSTQRSLHHISNNNIKSTSKINSSMQQYVISYNFQNDPNNQYRTHNIFIGLDQIKQTRQKNPKNFRSLLQNRKNLNSSSNKSLINKNQKISRSNNNLLKQKLIQIRSNEILSSSKNDRRNYNNNYNNNNIDSNFDSSHPKIKQQQINTINSFYSKNSFQSSFYNNQKNIPFHDKSNFQFQNSVNLMNNKHSINDASEVNKSLNKNQINSRTFNNRSSFQEIEYHEKRIADNIKKISNRKADSNNSKFTKNNQVMTSKNSLNGSNHQPYLKKMPYYNQINKDVSTLKNQQEKQNQNNKYLTQLNGMGAISNQNQSQSLIKKQRKYHPLIKSRTNNHNQSIQNNLNSRLSKVNSIQNGAHMLGQKQSIPVIKQNNNQFQRKICQNENNTNDFRFPSQTDNTNANHNVHPQQMNLFKKSIQEKNFNGMKNHKINYHEEQKQANCQNRLKQNIQRLSFNNKKHMSLQSQNSNVNKKNYKNYQQFLRLLSEQNQKRREQESIQNQKKLSLNQKSSRFKSLQHYNEHLKRLLIPIGNSFLEERRKRLSDQRKSKESMSKRNNMNVDGSIIESDQEMDDKGRRRKYMEQLLKNKRNRITKRSSTEQHKAKSMSQRIDTAEINQKRRNNKLNSSIQDYDGRNGIQNHSKNKWRKEGKTNAKINSLYEQNQDNYQANVNASNNKDPTTKVNNSQSKNHQVNEIKVNKRQQKTKKSKQQFQKIQIKKIPQKVIQHSRYNPKKSINNKNKKSETNNAINGQQQKQVNSVSQSNNKGKLTKDKNNNSQNDVNKNKNNAKGVQNRNTKGVQNRNSAKINNLSKTQQLAHMKNKNQAAKPTQVRTAKQKQRKYKNWKEKEQQEKQTKQEKEHHQKDKLFKNKNWRQSARQSNLKNKLNTKEGQQIPEQNNQNEQKNYSKNKRVSKFKQESLKNNRRVIKKVQINDKGQSVIVQCVVDQNGVEIEEDQVLEANQEKSNEINQGYLPVGKENNMKQMEHNSNQKPIKLDQNYLQKGQGIQNNDLQKGQSIQNNQNQQNKQKNQNSQNVQLLNEKQNSLIKQQKAINHSSSPQSVHQSSSPLKQSTSFPFQQATQQQFQHMNTLQQFKSTNQDNKNKPSALQQIKKHQKQQKRKQILENVMENNVMQEQGIMEITQSKFHIYNQQSEKSILIDGNKYGDNFTIPDHTQCQKRATVVRYLYTLPSEYQKQIEKFTPYEQSPIIFDKAQFDKISISFIQKSNISTQIKRLLQEVFIYDSLDVTPRAQNKQNKQNYNLKRQKFISKIFQPYQNVNQQIGVWIFCVGVWRLITFSKSQLSNYESNKPLFILKSLQKAFQRALQLYYPQNNMDLIQHEQLIKMMTGLRVSILIKIKNNKDRIFRQIGYNIKKSHIIKAIPHNTHSNKFSSQTINCIRKIQCTPKGQRVIQLVSYSTNEAQNKPKYFWIKQQKFLEYFNTLIIISRRKQSSYWSNKFLTISNKNKAVYMLQSLDKHISGCITLYGLKKLDQQSVNQKCTITFYKQIEPQVLKLVGKASQKLPSNISEQYLSRLYFQFNIKGTYYVFLQLQNNDYNISIESNTSELNLQFVEFIKKQTMKNDQCEYVEIDKMIRKKQAMMKSIGSGNNDQLIKLMNFMKNKKNRIQGNK